MLGALGWEGSTEALRNDCEPKRHTFFLPDRNCQITYDQPSSDCLAAPVSALATNFGIIDEWCNRNMGGLGGSHGNLAVGVNERFNPGPSDVELLGSGAVRASYSLEEDEPLVANDTSRVHDRQAQDSPVKRQGGEWHTQLSGVIIRRESRRRVSNILSTGVTQSWTFSETITESTTVSVDMGVDLFGVFSSSVGVDTTLEHSETVESGMEYTVGHCPEGEGWVYWEPVVDWWSGYFTDDPDTIIDIWIPRELNGYADGRFGTQCLRL